MRMLVLTSLASLQIPLEFARSCAAARVLPLRFSSCEKSYTICSCCSDSRATRFCAGVEHGHGVRR